MTEEIEKNEAAPEQTPPEQPAKTYSEAEYLALQNQLNDANKAIQSFQDMDIDSIKKSAEEWKQKAEQAETDRKNFEHKTRIAGFVKSLGLKNEIYETHVENILLEKGLQFDGGKLIGGDDIVKDFKEKYPDAFVDTRPKPQFADSTSGNSGKTPDDDMIRRIMGLK